MSEQLDRAARELWRLTPQPERDFRAAGDARSEEAPF